MSITFTEPLNRAKWLAYLGVPGMKEADESLLLKLDEAEKLLKDAASVKAIYKVLAINEISLEGVSIRRHLRDCTDVAVMAVTLGVGVDSLIRHKQVRDMAAAVILDCGASLLIEQACDIYQEQIKNEIGRFTTSRFSPGYGDYPLSSQQNIIKYIDGARKIGLTVTEEHLMIPRKSVTAIIGISDKPVRGSLATCGECILRDKCTLRKEGRNCGD